MLKHVLRSNDGSVFIFVALAVMAVVGSVGVAVDIGRGQMVQAKLQNSVDAAGLAAGATLSTTDLTTVATKYTNLNFGQGNLGATLGTVNAVLSTDKKILTVTASATLPTTMMKIFGKNYVTVNASTEVTRSNKGLEVALVLDTTGSMAGSKIASLKTASHDLVDILFGDNATQENLWVGVVPFSQTVNVGTAHADWMTADTNNWGTSSWGGCVEARWQTGRDITDDPPFDLAHPGDVVPAVPYERLKRFYYPDDANNNWIGSNTTNTSLCSNKSTCTCANYGPCTTTVAGDVSTTITCTGSGSTRSCNKAVTTTTYSITSSHGPNLYCPAVITPLTNVKATINTGIDALNAAGATHVNEGAAWGWRLISPRWRGYWGGSMNTNNLPLNYNSPLMSKAVIIMTDGENTTYPGSPGIYTAFNYPSVSGITDTALNTKTTAVCNALKAQGVIVYTILFEENSTVAINLMKNCATNPDYFFNSPSEDALQQAFHTIGDSLANLRISK